MIEITRPEGVFYLPENLAQRQIQRFKQEGSEPFWRERIAELLVKRPGSVISAGVCFGGMLTRIAAQASRVYAWEPSLENHKCAGATIAKNNLTNVQLRHAALGSANGTGTLTTGWKNSYHLGGCSSMVDDGVPRSKYLTVGPFRLETVAVECIDSFLYEDLSILQLDCEGSEYHALLGARATIELHRPLIIVEEHNGDSADLLASWNYALTHAYAGDCLYTPG